MSVKCRGGFAHGFVKVRGSGFCTPILRIGVACGTEGLVDVFDKFSAAGMVKEFFVAGGWVEGRQAWFLAVFGVLCYNFFQPVLTQDCIIDEPVLGFCTVRL